MSCIGLGIVYDRKTKNFLIAKFEAQAKCYGDAHVFPLGNPATTGLVYQHFMRFLFPILSSNEVRVLTFIMDRTLNWGKIRAKIQRSAFVTGDYTGDDCDEMSNVMNGCGLTTFKGVRDVIKRLVDKKLIIVDTRTKEYEIDFIGANQYVLDNGGGIKLSFRNREKTNNAAESTPERESSDEKVIPAITEPTEEVLATITSIDNNNFLDNNNSLAILPNRVQNKENRNRDIPSMKANIISIVEDNKQAYALHKKQKAAKNPNSLYPIFELWDQTCAKVYPEMARLQFTKKQYGQLGHFIKNVQWLDTQTLEGFIEFVASRWDLIRAQHFHYINKGRRETASLGPISFPDYPDFGFTMTFSRYFVNAYARHIHDRLTPNAQLISDLRKQGFTHQEIQAEIEERRKQDREHRNNVTVLKQRERELDILKSSFAAKEAGLKKRAEFMSSNIARLQAELEQERKRLYDQQQIVVHAPVENEPAQPVPVIVSSRRMTKEEMQISAQQIIEECQVPERHQHTIFGQIEGYGLDWAWNWNREKFQEGWLF